MTQHKPQSKTINKNYDVYQLSPTTYIGLPKGKTPEDLPKWKAIKNKNGTVTYVCVG